MIGVEGNTVYKESDHNLILHTTIILFSETESDPI